MLEGTGSSNKRYDGSPEHPLGSLDRSAVDTSQVLTESIDQVKMPSVGGFDTLLNRASQQRRSLNTQLDRSQERAINANRQAISSELQMLQKERERFLREKETWSIEKNQIKKRDMDQLQREREKLL